MADGVLGHRVLRLIDEAFRPDEAPAPKPAAEKKRSANGWTLVFVARDRYDEPWAVWRNADGEHRVAKGDGTVLGSVLSGKTSPDADGERAPKPVRRRGNDASGAGLTLGAPGSSPALSA